MSRTTNTCRPSYQNSLSFHKNLHFVSIIIFSSLFSGVRVLVFRTHQQKISINLSINFFFINNTFI